jgi:hypothetical protein
MGKSKASTKSAAAAAATASGPRRGGAAAFAASPADACSSGPDAADAADADGRRFALYQQAVQHPQGDLSWALRFHRTYAIPGGESSPPLHLREDFSGTALLAAAWLQGSPLRSALAVDLDAAALRWGYARNFEPRGLEARACLVRANVLDDLEGPDAALVPPPPPPTTGKGEEERETGGSRLRVLRRRADLVLALNYSLCLMHTRADAVRYLRLALRALSQGDPSTGGGGGEDEDEDEDEDGDDRQPPPPPSTGILMLDLIGGHTAEKGGALFARRNPLTGARFRWEQARYDPVARRLRSHLRLPDAVPGPDATFTYDWRLWTLPEAVDLLREAGHAGDVRVWVRRVREDDGGATVAVAEGWVTGRRRGESSDSGDDEEEEEEEEQEEEEEEEWGDEYVEYRPGALRTEELHALAEGWSAYVVAVVRRPA